MSILKKTLKSMFVASLCVATNLPGSLRASDHGDSPTVAGDQAADLADLYVFRDPIATDKVVLIGTMRGFIVPGEAANFGVFDPVIRYRFQIENTEDEKPDAFIDVRFSEKTGAGTEQTATVTFTGSAFDGLKGSYTAKTRVSTLDATIPANYFPVPPRVLEQKDKKGVTTFSDIEFFAGVVDDPFFFDIPGFVRFRDSVVEGSPNAASLSRGRDSFAGYNVLTVALKVPAHYFMSKNPRVTNMSKFGVNLLSQRTSERTVKGRKVGGGAFATVDRVGLPAINVALVPFARKNEYNAGTTIDDFKGKFIGDIGATLDLFNISPANKGILAGLLAKGDFLRLDTAKANAFTVSGRMLQEDVIDAILSTIAGGPLGDAVNTNDKAFSASFPYLGLPHLPLESGLDDPTRN